MRHLLTLVVWLLVVLFAHAESKDAVVRITSHGCSGTVIQTEPGRTLILTCAHAWRDAADKRTAIVIDAPVPTRGPAVSSSPRVVRINYDADLALVEMSTGPLPYVCSVAPHGAKARICLSVGYDEMRWPATVKRATVLSSHSGITWTTERPWHGRSGGALINEQGRLVGVVSGYEVDGSHRGMYASHDVILRFLGMAAQAPLGPGGGVRPSQKPMPPQTYEIRSPAPK